MYFVIKKNLKQSSKVVVKVIPGKCKLKLSTSNSILIGQGGISHLEE